MKISYKVPLIATGVILSAFAVFGAFQYRMIEKNIYIQTESHINEISVSLKAEITQWLNLRLQTISAMSEIIGDSTEEKAISNIMATKAFAPNATYYYGALEKGDGHMITNTAFDDMTDDWDGRTRPWYKLAMQNEDAMFTEPYPDSQSGELLITAMRKLNNNNGVLAADIKLKDISNALNVDFNKTGYAFLVDENGKIITHPKKGSHGSSLSSLFDNNKPKLLPTLKEEMADGQSVLTSFYRLEDFSGSTQRWYIGVVLDKNKVFAPAKELIFNAAIAAIITVIISSIVFYLFMLGTLIKPVRQLATQSDEISRGKLDSIISGVDRKDEIGELAKAVQRMEKALSMAMKRLKKLS